MIVAYASPSDVAVRWARTPSTEESALIQVRLNDVERMIRRRIPDLDTKITDGDIDVADLKQVESDAVLRLVRNPEGYLSETDGSYTYMLQSDLATGKLSINPEEWEMLGISRSRFAALTPYFEPGS